MELEAEESRDKGITNMGTFIKTCSICGGSLETGFILDFEDLLGSGVRLYRQHVGLCKNCGFICTQNPFTPEQLENRYKKMSKFEYDSLKYILDNNYKKQSQRQKHFLEENIDFQNLNSILEVGASSGYNLSQYKDCCEMLLGIEPSELNCRLSKENYDIELFQGMFDEYISSGRDDKFDLIILSMVLEHIVDPGAFVKELNKICSQYMFIEIPTLDLRSQEEPMGIFAEEHVNLFTLDSLNALMTRCGYSLKNVESIYGLRRYLPAGYPAIATIWEKRDRVNAPINGRYSVFTAQECLERYIADSKDRLKFVQEKIDSIPNQLRLAVWGVGHHASMLLANSTLKQKNIVRVYDSDERKHNIAFSGVPITGFSRKDIETGYVEGILLTTYTAQKAILRFINDQRLKCNLYVLYDI